MTPKVIKQLRSKFDKFEIDGYVVPKNDEFFSEYASKDRLKIISNFTGSAGFAIILKRKNYLFVDGRYTLQAKIESGKHFNISKYENIFNCKLFKNFILGIDPKLFTSQQLDDYFKKFNKIKEIDTNLIDIIYKKYSSKSKPFYSLHKNIVGENHLIKIKKVSDYLKIKNKNFLFVSAPENVAWILNIRGGDSPNSPIPNSRLLISKSKKIYLVSKIKKCREIIKRKKSFSGTSGVVSLGKDTNKKIKKIFLSGLEHHLAFTYGNIFKDIQNLGTKLQIPTYTI